MDTQKNSQRTVLKTRAIDVNTAFRGIGDLTSHVNRLAINAQVASSHLGEAGEPFAILVQELIKMASDLNEMVRNVESIFSKIVTNVAEWDRIEKKISLYREAARLIEGHNGSPVKPNDDHTEEIVSRQEDDSLKILFEQEISISEENMILHQKGLVKNAHNLISLIGSVRDLTQKQSVYIAITAKIESVRVSEHGDNLIHVSENITQVTNQIIEQQEKAESEIDQLLKEIKLFENRKNADAAEKRIA